MPLVLPLQRTLSNEALSELPLPPSTLRVPERDQFSRPLLRNGCSRRAVTHLQDLPMAACIRSQGTSRPANKIRMKESGALRTERHVFRWSVPEFLMMLQHLQPQAVSSRHSTKYLATHRHDRNKKMKWKNGILLDKKKKTTKLKTKKTPRLEDGRTHDQRRIHSGFWALKLF